MKLWARYFGTPVRGGMCFNHGHSCPETCVKNVKKIIEESKKKPVQYEDDSCKSIVDGAIGRLTGIDPYAASYKSRFNPFSGETQTPENEEEVAKLKQQEADQEEKKK